MIFQKARPSFAFSAEELDDEEEGFFRSRVVEGDGVAEMDDFHALVGLLVEGRRGIATVADLPKARSVRTGRRLLAFLGRGDVTYRASSARRDCCGNIPTSRSSSGWRFFGSSVSWKALSGRPAASRSNHSAAYCLASWRMR